MHIEIYYRTKYRIRSKIDVDSFFLSEIISKDSTQKNTTHKVYWFSAMHIKNTTFFLSASEPIGRKVPDHRKIHWIF